MPHYVPLEETCRLALGGYYPPELPLAERQAEVVAYVRTLPEAEQKRIAGGIHREMMSPLLAPESRGHLANLLCLLEERGDG